MCSTAELMGASIVSSLNLDVRKWKSVCEHINVLSMCCTKENGQAVKGINSEQCVCTQNLMLKIK